MSAEKGLFDEEAAPLVSPGRAARTQPLADRMRPRTLDEVIGQDHVLGADKPIGRMVAQRRLSSIILWGPPGCGKTTIARLLAQATDLAFEPLSAVFSGVADLRRVFDAAKKRRATGGGTLLFVDEIHRFNRAQQDGFLPYVEDGTIVLIGATTENPSFELNAALLSRAQVLVLNRLSAEALEQLLAHAEGVEDRLLPLDPAARTALIAMADGDGRFVLNLAEQVFALGAVQPLDPEGLAELVQRRAPLYDKSQEGELAIGQAVLYVSTAPKSNAAYRAFGAAKQAAKETGSLMPPKHILNAPTRLMKDLGYGRGYAYDHDQDDAFSGQNYFPEEMARQEFYKPTGRGFEKMLGERLAVWKRRRSGETGS